MNCVNKDTMRFSKAEFSSVFLNFLLNTLYLRNTNGPLAAFWMSYIGMIELVLHMIRASREGNWELHLSCVHQMLPWCFSYDAINYARSHVSLLQRYDKSTR